jgi:hypothetical protein
MVVKRILCPDRLRRVPKQFSWVDLCLVRDKHICGLSHTSLALNCIDSPAGVFSRLTIFCKKNALKTSTHVSREHLLKAYKQAHPRAERKEIE